MGLEAKVRAQMDAGAWRSLQSQCQTMERELPGNGWAVLYGRRTKVVAASQIGSLVDARKATSLSSRTWRTHFERFFAGEFGDERACDLLRTPFVERRRDLFGDRSVVVLDFFYGEPALREEWAGTEHQGLREITLPGDNRGPGVR